MQHFTSLVFKIRLAKRTNRSWWKTPQMSLIIWIFRVENIFIEGLYLFCFNLRFLFHSSNKMKDVSKYDAAAAHSIEYERQRHLAHWLLESSPHMPKPNSTAEKSSSSSGKKKKSAATAIGSIINSNNNNNNTTPVIFCLNRLSTNTTSSSLSKAPPLFSNSQSNLPLQIVTARDGHKAKIRRFNSHDTSANMFSVADFENARLARRNELENALLMKQKNRYKMNSLSSGGDYSTGDSKGSKFSNEVSWKMFSKFRFNEDLSTPFTVKNYHSSTLFGTRFKLTLCLNLSGHLEHYFFF